MASYKEDVAVSKLRLTNQGMYICTLKCAHKKGQDDDLTLTGKTEYVELFTTEELDLTTLGLSDDEWVTASFDVLTNNNGKTSDVWLKYSSKSTLTADFISTGNLFNTNIIFVGAN